VALRDYYQDKKGPNLEKLAADTLQEIPEQFLDYMYSEGVLPNSGDIPSRPAPEKSIARSAKRQEVMQKERALLSFNQGPTSDDPGPMDTPIVYIPPPQPLNVLMHAGSSRLAPTPGPVAVAQPQPYPATVQYPPAAAANPAPQPQIYSSNPTSPYATPNTSQSPVQTVNPTVAAVNPGYPSNQPFDASNPSNVQQPGYYNNQPVYGTGSQPGVQQQPVAGTGSQPGVSYGAPPPAFVAPPPAPPQYPQARASFAFAPSAPGQIGFNPGELMLIIQRDPSGWWEVELNGTRGWVPANHLTPL